MVAKSLSTAVFSPVGEADWPCIYAMRHGQAVMETQRKALSGLSENIQNAVISHSVLQYKPRT